MIFMDVAPPCMPDSADNVPRLCVIHIPKCCFEPSHRHSIRTCFDIPTRETQVLEYRRTSKYMGLIVSVGGALTLVLWSGPVVLKSTLHVHLFQLDATSDELIGCTMIVVGISATSLWYVLLYCIAMQRHVVQLYPAEISLTAMMSLFGTIQTGIVSALAISKSAWELQWLNVLTLIVLLLGGIFVTGLAYYLMTWSVNKKGPVFTAAFNPLLIFFSILLQTVVLGSSTHLGSIVGAVLVMIGLYFLLWQKRRNWLQ